MSEPLESLAAFLKRISAEASRVSEKQKEDLLSVDAICTRAMELHETVVNSSPLNSPSREPKPVIKTDMRSYSENPSKRLNQEGIDVKLREENKALRKQLKSLFKENKTLVETNKQLHFDMRFCVSSFDVVASKYEEAIAHKESIDYIKSVNEEYKTTINQMTLDMGKLKRRNDELLDIISEAMKIQETPENYVLMRIEDDVEDGSAAEDPSVLMGV